MNQVVFHSADVSISLKNKRRVKVLIQEIFKQENYRLKKVVYVFCSDEYLLQLNKQHLHHDYFTDTLTFQLSSSEQPVEGEIYISIDRIEENAKLYKVPYENELLRVIIHSALHLCGYKDDSKRLKHEMHQKENFYIDLYEKYDSRET
jgi:rRNA maturation RNase YbeY